MWAGLARPGISVESSTPGGNLGPGATTNPHWRSGIIYEKRFKVFEEKYVGLRLQIGLKIKGNVTEVSENIIFFLGGA